MRGPGAYVSEEQNERIADYFAGCLLMPKRHVKRLFGQRLSLIRMADTFGVTHQAMHVRLSQLGLVAPTPRCNYGLQNSSFNYFRKGSLAA
jgi:Zn-dependent peptidase ImmA (M78 family)